VITTNGGNTFNFILDESFTTEEGNTVTFARGDRPVLSVFQSFDRGSSGAGTSFSIE